MNKALQNPSLRRPKDPVRDQCEAYGQLFDAHLYVIQSRHKSASTNLTNANALLNELDVQSEALKAALRNHNIHQLAVDSAFKSFKAWAQPELVKRDHLLHSFEADLYTLKELKVNSEIFNTNVGQRALVDFLSENDLRNFARECLDIHGNLFYIYFG